MNTSVMSKSLGFAEVKCNSERYLEAWLHKGCTVYVRQAWLISSAVLLNLCSIQRHLENKTTAGYETQLPRLLSNCSFCSWHKNLWKESESNISELAQFETGPVVAGLSTYS